MIFFRMEQVGVDFTSFHTESLFDVLTIYDGNSSSGEDFTRCINSRTDLKGRCNDAFARC